MPLFACAVLLPPVSVGCLSGRVNSREPASLHTLRDGDAADETFCIKPVATVHTLVPSPGLQSGVKRKLVLYLSGLLNHWLPRRGCAVSPDGALL